MIQNEITFNNVKTEGFPRGSWPIILDNQQGPDEDGGIINAVDIDWNEALLNMPILNNNIVEITTTGLLLKVIQDLANKIPNIEELDQRYRLLPTLVMPEDLILYSPSGEVDVTAEVRGENSPITYTWAIKLEDYPYAKLKYYDSGTDSEIEDFTIEGDIPNITIVATNEVRSSITSSDSGLGGILIIGTNNNIAEGEGTRSYLVYCNAEPIEKPYIKTQLRIVEVSLVTDPSYPSSTGVYKFYVIIPGDNRDLTEISNPSNFSWSVSTSGNYSLQESAYASGRPYAPNLLYITPLNNTFLEQEATIECTVTWENGYSLTFSKTIIISPRLAYSVTVNDSNLRENFIVEGTPSTSRNGILYFAAGATISVTGPLDYNWPYYNLVFDLVSDLLPSISYDNGLWHFVMPNQNVGLNLVLSTLYEITFNDLTGNASISIEPVELDGIEHLLAPEGLDVIVTTIETLEISASDPTESYELEVTSLENNLYKFTMPAGGITITVTTGTD